MPGYCLRDLHRLGMNAEADLLLGSRRIDWVLHGKRIELFARVTAG